jgi:hypothetical protein
MQLKPGWQILAAVCDGYEIPSPHLPDVNDSDSLIGVSEHALPPEPNKEIALSA